LSICRVNLICQIRKFKITKLKQQVMPTYCPSDSKDVTENDYRFVNKKYSGGQNKVGQVLLRNLAKIELSKPGLL
jgi:hypothetical protein